MALIKSYVYQVIEQQAKLLYSPFDYIVGSASPSLLSLLFIFLLLPVSIVFAVRLWKSNQVPRTTASSISFFGALIFVTVAVCAVISTIFFQLIPMGGNGGDGMDSYYNAVHRKEVGWYFSYPILLLITYLDLFTIILPPYPPKYWKSTLSRIMIFLCVCFILASFTLSAPGRYI